MPGGAASSGRLQPPLPPEVEAAAADPSRRVGRYILLAELGRGGMGVVHRAWDTSLHRGVAIKSIVGTTELSEKQRKRFELEGRAAARLRHSDIVSVHEVGVHQGQPFLVMDLIEGESFEALLTRASRLAPRRVAEIVRRVALAAAHAHAEGIVHRDIKPENIIIATEDDHPFLTDFGLAREVTAEERLTVSGQVLGTPAYMAPEQVGATGAELGGEGQAEVGPPADVYALGGVLYRALLGRTPFSGGEGLDVIRKVLFEEPERPRAIDPAVHRDLETIALRCLEKRPDRRYPTASELADDLERFLKGELIRARPVGRIEGGVRWAKRHRLLAASLLVLVLVVASSLVGFVALVQRRRQRVVAAEAELEASATTRAIESRGRFEEARSEAAPAKESDAERRTRLDRVLALGLGALEAAGAAQATRADDAEATGRVVEAAIGFADVAREAEQWSVAVSALTLAAEVGAPADVIAERVAAVEADRDRLAREHRATIEAVLEDGRTGKIAAAPGAYEDALFVLVRYPEPQTVALIAAALGEVRAELEAAIEDLHEVGARPTAEEAGADETAIEGVERAVERLIALDPGAPLDADSKRILDQVARRLEEREAHRRRGDHAAAPRAIGALIASAQTERVGHGAALFARLCCEALGYLGLPAAREPLTRYLAVEHDGTRAAHAAIALLLLEGERAAPLVRRIGERFEADGTFWTSVEPELAALETDG